MRMRQRRPIWLGLWGAALIVTLGIAGGDVSARAHDGAFPRNARPAPSDRFGRPVRQPNGNGIIYRTDAAERVVAHPTPVPPRITVDPSRVPLEWFRSVAGTGIGLTGLTVADLDGDGESEILAGASAGGFSGNSYWYILRHAPGGYATEFTSPPYAQQIWSLRAADVTGDGVPEIIVGLQNQILIYGGASRRLMRTIVTAGDEVRSLAVADVDADGALELVFCDDHALYIYGVDSGAQEFVGTGLGASDLAIGNVDGVPGLEIVLAGTPGRVLDGATRAATWSYASGFGERVRVGDLDGDGRDEIVAAAAWQKITVFDADVRSIKYEVNTSLDVAAVRLADVDRDGKLELVYGDGQWGSVYVLEGATGSPRWSVRNPEHGVTDIAVGDTDGDGGNELLWGAGYTSTGPDRLYVLDIDSRVIEWQSEDIVGPFHALDYGDLDHDGANELLLGSLSSDSGYGDGRFFIHDAGSKALEYASGEPTGLDWTGLYRIRHANLDHDAQDEILVSTSVLYTGKIICYDGISHTEQWRASTPDGLAYRSLQVADLNGDGAPEVIAGTERQHTGAPGVYVMVYDGATGAELWRSPSLGDYWGSLSLLRVANIDSDPAPEILVAQYGGDLYVFDGVTHALRWVAYGLHVTSLAVADVDGDGVPEIFVGTADARIRKVDRKTGSTTLIGTYANAVEGLNVLDVDGDGVSDYVFGQDSRIVIEDGRAPAYPLWDSGPTGIGVGRDDSLFVADIDRDGRLEIVVNAGEVGVQVFEIRHFCEDDGSHLDCNHNGRADNCDLENGFSRDCDANAVPDECEPDTDVDGITDVCDNCPATMNPSQEDADADGRGDACDVCPHTPDPGQADGDRDGVGDACDDCPGTPPATVVDPQGCPAYDCNHNRVDDGQDIAAGTSVDCDHDGLPDECVLLSAACPFRRGDVTNDGHIDGKDLLGFAAIMAGANQCGCSVAAADINGDGLVNQADATPLLVLVRCNRGTIQLRSPHPVADLEDAFTDALRQVLAPEDAPARGASDLTSHAP
jgi:VCBS repeat protein/dockerin type I repeat protein